jgi:hypothetical protein
MISDWLEKLIKAVQNIHHSATLFLCRARDTLRDVAYQGE